MGDLYQLRHYETKLRLNSPQKRKPTAASTCVTSLITIGRYSPSDWLATLLRWSVRKWLKCCNNKQSSMINDEPYESDCAQADAWIMKQAGYDKIKPLSIARLAIADTMQRLTYTQHSTIKKTDTGCAQNTQIGTDLIIGNRQQYVALLICINHWFFCAAD